MIRWHHFVIITVSIFVIERLLPMSGLRIPALFPLFAITFLWRSRDIMRDFNWLIAPTLIFDLFSGFEFGIFTLAILLTAGTIYLIKKNFGTNQSSILLSTPFFIFFLFEYLIIYWFKFSWAYFSTNIFYILIYSLGFYFMLSLILRRISNGQTR